MMILPARRRSPPLRNRQRGVLGLPQFRAVIASGAGGGGGDGTLVFLNHCEGANLATTAVSTVGGNLIQAASGARVSTTEFKFGTSSIFNDSAGSMQTLSSDASLSPGTGPYAWEGWVRPNNGAVFGVILDCRQGATDGYFPCVYQISGTWNVWFNGATAISGGSPISATWQYWMMTRLGTTTSLFVGTSGTAALIGSFTDSNNYPTNQYVTVANASGGGQGLAGYFDDYRMRVGIGYSGSSVPVPTSAFPDS